MGEHYAKLGAYRDEPAILLKSGRYSAVMLPGIGGNLVSFRDDEHGFHFLREPSDEEWREFKRRPMVHGIPVLFPPNRYEDGEFVWNGKTYRFPVNEPATNNHLHGFVYDQPWETADFGRDAGKSRVTVKHVFGETHPNYRYFPHTFTLTLTYTLSADGLRQDVSVVNEGGEPMPLMLGFHTAVNAPFAPGSTADDCRLLLTIGQRVELSPRMLPTGEFQTLSENERRIKEGLGSPYAEDMDNHYTAEPRGAGNMMELTDTRAGVKLVYETGEKFPFWMVWNTRRSRRYFCPEPQTSLVNAPRAPFPPERTGLIALGPGESWTAACRMYAEDA